MKLYKALALPALLISAMLTAQGAQSDANFAADYFTHWNEVLNGQGVSIIQTSGLDAAIVKNCKTLAPQQYRREIVNLWGIKTGTRLTQNAFLSEDLQMFDRLAAISCLEGADYQRKGSGERLMQALNVHLQEMDAKDGNDAYEQIKTMEFQTGIITARYGMGIEKNRVTRSN